MWAAEVAADDVWLPLAAVEEPAGLGRELDLVAGPAVHGQASFEVGVDLDELSASDHTEGMSCRIGENPRLVMRLMIRLARTQLQQSGLSLVQVLLDLETDVKLLRNALVRPARSTVVVDPLEANEKSVLAVETGELVI